MEKIIIGLIILLTVILRFYQLTNYPSGFHIDETTLGYNAYSILTTGRDESGRFLPLYSTSFGLDRAIGNFLITAISVAIFGLNEFAVRFIFALFGVLTVFLFYIFAREIFPNYIFALLTMFFLSISPWHIDMSRASSEANISLFFILLGQLFYLKGVRLKNYKLVYPSYPGLPSLAGSKRVRWVDTETNRSFFSILLSIISFVVSIFFYHAAIGFILLSSLASGIFIWLRSSNFREKLNVAITQVALIALLILFFIFGQGGANRLNQVGFHKDPNVINEQNKMFYDEGPNNILTARIYHNKMITYSRAFINNYSQYFTIDYLFLNAGKPPRYTPPAMGLIYIIELPFILIGIIKIINKKTTNLVIVLIFLLMSPVVAALTYEDAPNVQRSFFMVGYIEILTAYGVFSSLYFLNRHPLILRLFISVLVLSMIYYLHQYYVLFPVHNPLYRNDGDKELVTEVMKIKDSYSRVIMTNDPEEPFYYFLFYTKFDPKIFQHKYSKVKESSTGWLFEDKILFSKDGCPSQRKDMYEEENALIVDGSICEYDEKVQARYKLISAIARKDGSIAYRLLERRNEN